MKLDELQRLAEGAAPVPDWWSEHSLRDHLRVADGVCPECDPPFIAAMSPDTAKKLIAVALAAQAYVNDELDFAPNDGKRWAALRTALEELKS